MRSLSMNEAHFVHQHKDMTRRSVIVIAVILLHLTIVYTLATGLASKTVKVVLPPVMVRIIEEKKVEERKVVPQEIVPPRPPKLVRRPPPPPPAPVRSRRPQISPKPKAPSEAPMTARSSEPPPPTAQPSPSPSPSPSPLPQQSARASSGASDVPHVPVHTAPLVDSRSCRKPEYPSASIRFEETGTVVLNFLIAEDGRVVDSRIVSSSGYPRLDEAARRALNLCRFTPGTVDGKPKQSWHKLKYVWKLDQ